MEKRKLDTKLETDEGPRQWRALDYRIYEVVNYALSYYRVCLLDVPNTVVEFRSLCIDLGQTLNKLLPSSPFSRISIVSKYIK